MNVLILECPRDEKDVLIAELNERGTRGIIEQELPGGGVRLQAFFEESLPPGNFAPYNPRWEPADETNWARVVMDSWEPVEAGERFFIVPDWRDDPTPPGRLRLEVHPGVALGTGYHATTQMCLEAMEHHLRPADTFFDLGTGSGILSQAAWLLGPRRIIACDTDPQATESAAANLRRANVPVLLFTGSAPSIADGAADFLAANISAPVLLNLAGEIRRCLAPGGRSVLSGFSPDESARLRHGFESAGFGLIDRDARDDWACLLMRKTAR